MIWIILPSKEDKYVLSIELHVISRPFSPIYQILVALHNKSTIHMSTMYMNERIKFSHLIGCISLFGIAHLKGIQLRLGSRTSCPKVGYFHDAPGEIFILSIDSLSLKIIRWHGPGGGDFWTRPKACRGSPRGGFRGRSPPDAGKIFKKTNEKLQFYGNFSKFQRKFCDIYKIF